MRSRLIRLGLVTTAVLGLLGTTAPPAQSATYMLVVFDSLVNLDGPLSYPCVGSTTIDLFLCPTNPRLVTDLPLPTDVGGIPTNFHVDYGHNKRHITNKSVILCEDVAFNIAKGGKAPAQAGACSFFLIPKEPVPTADQNTISGSCGLLGGQITFELTDDLGQKFYADLHFTGNPTITFTGHVRKRASGQTGKVVGEAVAVPLPDNVGPPPSGNSCLSKTATLFTVVGLLYLVTV
jgi:hypothetical protein